jgi:hypothetical protein
VESEEATSDSLPENDPTQRRKDARERKAIGVFFAVFASLREKFLLVGTAKKNPHIITRLEQRMMRDYPDYYERCLSHKHCL